MNKNNFTKAKRKWYKKRLKEARIYYEFGCGIWHLICEYDYHFSTWDFNQRKPSLILEKYEAVERFFWNMSDKFFTARNLSFKNPKVMVEYETVKSSRKKELEMLKEVGLLK